MSTLENIGIRIKDRRKKLGMSQSDLAEKVNLAKESRTQISKWESGIAYPTIEQIPPLCDALKCDAGYLFGEYTSETLAKETIIQHTGLSSDSVDKLMANVSEDNSPFIKYHGEPWENMSIGKRRISFLDYIINRRDFGYLCILFHKFMYKVSLYDDRKNQYAEYRKRMGKTRPIYARDGYYNALRQDINKAEFEFLLGWSQSLREKDEISIIGDTKNGID